MTIDRLIAAKVMGYEYQQDAPEGFYCLSVGNNQGWWRKDRSNPKDWVCEQCSWDFHPSTNIAQAFEVVDKMDDLGFEFFFNNKCGDEKQSELDCYWQASFVTTTVCYQKEADNPANAICLAALEAVKKGKND
jgi:hypothetical protein